MIVVRVHTPTHTHTADSVTLTGGNDLPYIALRDTFDTYNENSWTYDGRYMCSHTLFPECNALSSCFLALNAPLFTNISLPLSLLPSLPPSLPPSLAHSL